MSYTLKSGAALAAMMMLAACGGSEGGSGKVNAKSFAAACEGASNMGPELCACIADKAMTELSPEAREFVVAGLNEDQPRADAARSRMKTEELMVAGTFMVNAPAACAREMSSGG